MIAVKESKIRDAGTTGAAGAVAPVAFCLNNFTGAEYGCTKCPFCVKNFH